MLYIFYCFVIKVSEGIPRANSKYTLPNDIVITKAPPVKQSKSSEKVSLLTYAN